MYGFEVLLENVACSRDKINTGRILAERKAQLKFP
jgi:hypothetical protein